MFFVFSCFHGKINKRREELRVYVDLLRHSVEWLMSWLRYLRVINRLIPTIFVQINKGLQISGKPKSEVFTKFSVVNFRSSSFGCYCLGNVIFYLRYQFFLLVMNHATNGN